MNERTCKDCGQTFQQGPTFACGEGFSEVWFPDRCHPCEMEYTRRRPRRIFKAYQLSQLNAQQASDLTRIPPEWFTGSTRIGDALYGSDDPFLLDEECGQVVAKLLAVARQRKSMLTPTNVVAFSRARRAVR